jgi:PAS domain S-box-containing protein
MTSYNVAELAQTLFEEAGDALFLFEPDTEQMVDVNPMAQRLSGFGRDELLRMQVTYLFRGEAQGGLTRLRAAFHKTGVFHSQEGFLLRHKQEGVWVPVNLTITRLHAEPRTLGLITARDISERRRIEQALVADVAARRQAEEALRDSERRYRLLFERNLAGVFRSTVEGRLLDCNHSFARILGYDSREQILACHALELYLEPADRAAVVKRLHAEGQINNAEILLRRRDGSPVWVLENVSLLGDNGGAVLEGTIVDISAQKQTEDALRASEAKYRTVVENLDQSIFLKDANLRFVAANPSFCNSLGVSEADLVGRTDFEFYPQHLAEKYRADDLIVLAEGRHLTLEEENLQGGRTRTVRVVKTPVKDDRGRIMGVLGIFWDVTEQRALEAELRQAQKMEAIGQLAGGVAHDFNNLLTVILGNVSLLLPRRGAEDPERELLLTAEQAALRAAELTRRLLGFSRRTMLRAEPINLNHCIEETVRILRRTIDPRIRVETRTRPDLWTVRADQAQLNQVLMNLCLNARDAMPEGGRLLLETDPFVPDEEYLRLHLDARPGEFVRLRVRDTGYGIPPEIRPRIFEPFFTTKDTGKGTGLGLAMVFGIVKQHRGWIDCDSVVHEGTTFDLYLPRYVGQEAGGASAPDTSRPAPAGKETILLVDDEPMIRQLGTMILERQGYGVLLASDGVEALEVYRQNRGKIDLVILDLTMPRLSGRDTFKRLVEMDPGIRVLFSSGYSAEHIPATEFSQVLGFLNKPYRADELAAKLRATLDQARGRPPREG